MNFLSGKGSLLLFIIKNDYRLQQTFLGDKQKKTSQYLLNYAKINKRTLERIRKGQIKVSNTSIQLKLPIEEPIVSEEELAKYENFFIIVYKTNVEKVIESVQLVLPDDQTKELHVIQDLSAYLQTTSITIEAEEYSAVVGENEEIGTIFDYDYTVPKEEKDVSNE